MDFDFDDYLRNLDPDVTYSIKRVTGGVVNLTVRATKKDGDIDNGRFPGRASVILKYAPPHVAGVGESAPMSPFRQTIEARALGLFLSTRPDSLHHILTDSEVTVPKLLNHDSESNVIVISDLGKLPNLSDIFSDLGGFPPGSSAISVSDFPKPDQPLTNSQTAFFENIGIRLGHFFRRLHKKQTLEIIRLDSPEDYFENPDTRTAILEHAIKPIAEHLKHFPSLIDGSEADLLTSWAVQDFQREILDDEKALVLGDCWTGAVLVDTSPSDPSPKVGVIDWEFAGTGRGRNSDMSQFMAHLELFYIATEQNRERYVGHRQALNALVSGLTEAYTSKSGNQDGSERAIKPVSLAEATQMRSAFLSHGAELINCALWKKWECDEDSCSGKSGDQASAYDCKIVKSMIERGIWFLRHATKDPETFYSGENWTQLDKAIQLHRESGQRWLMDLF